MPMPSSVEVAVDVSLPNIVAHQLAKSLRRTIGGVVILDSTECRSHGFKYPLITRKSNPAFLSDEFVTNPNSELTRFTASGFDV